MVVLTPLKDSLSLSDTLFPCGIVFEIKKGTRVLTLRTLDTNAANLVAINRYQCVRLLPARVVISTDWVNHLLIILPRVCAWLLKLTCTLLAWYLSVSTE